MGINKENISICRNRPLYKYPFALLVLLICVKLCGCYSSTAVKGTPVKELIEARDRRILPGADQVKNKKVIAELSSVKGNKTFKELDGIPEYIIGPFDELEINSHIGDKVTTKEITVDSRGYVTYSFIDDLQVSGLTPSELDKVLSEKMSSYIKNPRIDVLVREYKSKSATVLGEFSSLRATGSEDAGSGRINLEGKTKLMDLFALAGGYTVDGDIKRVKLVRKGKTYVINVYDIIEKGDDSQNVIIDDGDVVDVPELGAFRERVYVMGEVNSQGIYSLKDARDLLGALALAGNVTTLAMEENTLIVRGYSSPGDKPLVMMADVKALFRNADMDQNVVLEEGDLVYVPRMKIGDINDWITNTMPLLDFLFYPGQFQDNYFSRDYLKIK
ncbi:polysaccharide biosynthesis/export family protein [Thermodesulfobacteriota bacterium]